MHFKGPGGWGGCCVQQALFLALRAQPGTLDKSPGSLRPRLAVCRMKVGLLDLPGPSALGVRSRSREEPMTSNLLPRKGPVSLPFNKHESCRLEGKVISVIQWVIKGRASAGA